ncbi:MAG: DNA-binding protein [Gammaproteobacteria bacterium]
MSKTVRLSLDVSQALNDTLEQMSEVSHTSKSEILRKSIALMEVALDEKQKGHQLGVIQDQKVIKEIIGI